MRLRQRGHHANPFRPYGKMRTAHFIGNARKSAVLLRFIYNKKRCGDNTIKQYFCYFKAIRGAAARRFCRALFILYKHCEEKAWTHLASLAQILALKFRFATSRRLRAQRLAAVRYYLTCLLFVKSFNRLVRYYLTRLLLIVRMLFHSG